MDDNNLSRLAQSVFFPVPHRDVIFVREVQKWLIYIYIYTTIITTSAWRDDDGKTD